MNRRSPRLAPFYDLVCTRNYKNISRHLAMSLGGISDPYQIGIRELHAMAEDLGVRAPMVIKSAISLSEQLTEAIPDVIERFTDNCCSSPVLECIPIIICKQIRRM